MCSRSASFFDFRKAKGPRTGPDVGEESLPAPAGEAPAAPMTVSALLGRIKGALTSAFPQRLCVVGELSNVKLHGSGHLYFRLKDAEAAIDAVMFRAQASRLKFQPADGLEVIVEARVDVYEARGQLQIYVEDMTPKGAGALDLAFRQLVEKLRAKGLFDESAKKPLPRFPRAVGVITSATGAAVRDIRRTLRRRWKGVRVYLMPALVQGEGAAASIAEALRLLDANAGRLGIDTILLARGGGSLEDLWAFNEEVVARAVYACRTPIITGIGHEADVTVADLVADVRAATPTAAAELATPDAAEVRRHVAQLARRLGRAAGQALESARAALEAVLRSAVFRDPAARVRTQAQRLDELSGHLRAALGVALAAGRRRLEPAAQRLAALHPARLAERASARLAAAAHRLAWVLGGRSKRAGDHLAGVEARLAAVHPAHRVALARQKLQAAGRQLEAMSHRSVLSRGFSVTRRADGTILRSAGAVKAGQRIETELADGRIHSIVDRAPGAPLPPRAARTRPDQPRLFE